MNIQIFDVEADGLKPTKLHCLAVSGEKIDVKATSNYDNMRKFFLEADVLVGHNIYRFDIPVVERILGIKIKAKLVDTLALSWYLEPEMLKHGLAEWGEVFGVPKPKVDDWHNLPLKEYIHRCSEDVKINTKLWNRFWKHLMKLYGSEEAVWKFIDYLMYKMDCAREQERSGWKLDVDRCREAVANLDREKKAKLIDLIKAMPKVKKFVTKSKPAKPFKKDGTPSSAGTVWFDRLRELNLPIDYKEDLRVQVGEEEPNPNSSTQVKEWLYSLGWKPTTFKYNRDKETGDVRKIPQVNSEFGAGLCDSVKRLYDREPSLDLLDGLGVISHRIGLLNGFLTSVDENGYIQAQIQGLTNTLRFKHKTAVNLPKVGKAYGDIIRGCLIAPDGYELCGSDMSSLEDRLKQHYIFPHDPDYVNEMNTPDFDPHLDLALNAGEVNAEQVRKYKSGEDKSIKGTRDTYKTGNYALQYKCGIARLAIALGSTVAKATLVYNAYWKRNWAIEKVAKEQKTKTIDGQMWLLNPINGFWYSLRFEKDIFSTLVQGSASYVFDLWVSNFRAKRPQLTAQFHDEVVLCVKRGKGIRDRAEALLRKAIAETNEQLKLNRDLDIDVQFGSDYSQIH